MTFEQWMREVNRIVTHIAGVSVHDLADATFRDWYDDEYTPNEAANEVLEANGWDA